MLITPTLPQRSRDRRKSFGTFYTPPWLAELLVDWALDKTPGAILDPSFGGCAFLLAARNKLYELAGERGPTLVFGLDIDPDSRQYAEELIQLGVPRDNLIRADFFSTRMLGHRARYNAIVGNPPYIRHHALSDESIAQAQKAAIKLGIRLPKTCSTWAYFCVLATAKLEHKGNMALILPGALLQAGYASHVLNYLVANFASVRLIHVHDRLFSGTHEESVILLALKKQDGEGSLGYQRVKRADQIGRAINSAEFDITIDASYKAALLPQETLQAWNDIIARRDLTTLDMVCKVRIGVVTGANDFFIRTPSDPLFRSRQVNSIRIISNSKWLEGPNFSNSDMSALDNNNELTRLAMITGRPRSGSLLAHEIRSAQARHISQRAHCKKRHPWWNLGDAAIPDLFLRYMSANAPTLISNDANATCTNSIHRLFLRERSAANKLSLVASSLTSLFAFECEFFGRHYGGGVLKLEPSSVNRLHVSASEASRAYDLLASSQLSAGDLRHLADELILKRLLGISQDSIDALRSGEQLLRIERSRYRSSRNTPRIKRAKDAELEVC